MAEQHKRFGRRRLFAALGAAGLASVFVAARTRDSQNTRAAAEPAAPSEDRAAKQLQVPRRKLGRTKAEVPCLALGMNILPDESQMILRKALEWGVTYWDTAPFYTGGNSDRNIGRFLEKNPQAREKLFIVSKATEARDVRRVDRLLQLALKRMNTDYVDLYMGVHPLEHPGQLTDELKYWAKKAKKKGVIRFFGFSTHENMARNLAAAARLDWIDVIMVNYNFRLMQDQRMQAAVDACHKAGIGLIAMKTQGKGPRYPSHMRYKYRIETQADKKLVGHFLLRGFTAPQAKIKVVLQDERISSTCVGLSNTAVLASNVAAVLDKTKLTPADMRLFKEYSAATGSCYCAGCSHICNSAVADAPYVCDIMRSLMYYKSYGRGQMAREQFARIPRRVRNKLLRTDYSLAEACCPQRLPIAELVAEAVSKLT
ncbi:MAG: aldo/keto reductase [Planctomycetota bacterium]|jgi:aryl-alcohol dehydrogenase-like predicted oxidoreductase